jgi:hypothetical protein
LQIYWAFTQAVMKYKLSSLLAIAFKGTIYAGNNEVHIVAV